MRSSRRVVVLTTLAVVVAACTPAATPVPTAAPTPTAGASPAGSPQASPTTGNPADIRIPKPAGNLTIKISHPTTAFSFNALAALITHDRLRADGWTIQDSMLTNGELAVAAVADGTTNIGEGTIAQALVAAQTGKSLKWLVGENPTEFVIISKAEIQRCEDLNGKIFAINSAGSQYTAMSNQYMAACNAKPASTLTISGGDVRIVGMQNGQIDATYVQLPDWVTLNQQAPGKYRILVNFAESNKAVSGAAFYANGAWLAANRAVAIAYVAELLKTNRMTDRDPSLISAAAAKHMPNLKFVPEMIEAYRGLGWWPVNGALTREAAAGSIKFYEDTKVLPPGVTVDQVVDFGIIEEALKLVGGPIAGRA
jgi:NitT/TauT family transport system substrate-binding protein